MSEILKIHFSNGKTETYERTDDLYWTIDFKLRIIFIVAKSSQQIIPFENILKIEKTKEDSES